MKSVFSSLLFKKKNKLLFVNSRKTEILPYIFCYKEKHIENVNLYLAGTSKGHIYSRQSST